MTTVVPSVLKELAATLAQGRPVAYCRLVETRGSTPQKAGAVMLVYPDGSQAGTLGGGCVEAEVKRRALIAFQRGVANLEVFQLDHDYGWDDGLICGGRMTVLIQPLGDRPELTDYYRQLAKIEPVGGGTEVIVVDPEASGLPVATSLLFDAQQRPVAATVDSSFDTQAIVRSLRSLSERPRSYIVDGLACLPILARCHLLLVGGGHISKAIAHWADDLEFDVWVVDDRPEFVTAERFPDARERWSGPLDDVLPGLPLTPDSYCLILTRGHAHDERALYHLIQRDVAYLGMIGSRRKIRMIFEDLIEEGIEADALARVYAPLGIDIGSQTVPEIAVSICAELVAHRNLGGNVPGRPRSIHLTGPGEGSEGK